MAPETKQARLRKPPRRRLTARRAAAGARSPLTFEDAVRLCRQLPGVETTTMHGATALKVGGRLLACPALHRSAEPNSLMVRIDIAERARLIAAQPQVYYVTAHYLRYPSLLVRLSCERRSSLRRLLHLSWQFAAKHAARKRKPERARP